MLHKTRILHFVYLTRKNLLCLPYQMKISNNIVCIVVAGTVHYTQVSPFSQRDGKMHS